LIGVLGRNRLIRVGSNIVRFLVVDPDCPTIRHAVACHRLRAFRFRSILWNEPVEKVLVTATNPVNIVLVYSTYPKLVVRNYHMERNSFNYFFYELCDIKPDREEPVNWLKEGF